MKSLKELLEDIQEEELLEAKNDIAPEPEDEPIEGEEEDEGEEKEEKLDDHAPKGKGHYTADDLREIIDYVKDLIKKEEDEDDEDDDDADDDVGEVGLDLIYEYADLLPETVINQMVDDLKDMFEIEDTMLESIVTEGSAFFNKGRKGPAAKAARRKMMEFYKKNKNKIKIRNKKWRNSEMGKKMAKLHSKIYSSTATMGKAKGKRIVHRG